MLSQSARDRLVVVLVGARNPQNIGAAARAMQDFGFSHLRVVNEYAPPFEAAQLEASSAVGASAEVMRAARHFRALPEALEDCGLVAGTTAVGGRGLTQEVVSLQEAAPGLRSAMSSAAEELEASRNVIEDGVLPPEPRIALLFGSEKTGLTNEQLSYCTLLLTIPMFAPAGRHLSMNLGQAVAVCLYELGREGFEGVRALPETEGVSATSGDRERLLALLLEVMERSGYARRFPANTRPEVVRRLVGQLGVTREEASTWMGLYRILLRRLNPELQGPHTEQKSG